MKPLTSPMNLTCKSASSSSKTGAYEYCIRIDTAGTVSAPSTDWERLPDFTPDANGFDIDGHAGDVPVHEHGVKTGSIGVFRHKKS